MTMLRGNRWNGFYSLNRMYADILDQKRRGSLTVLTRADTEALRDSLEAIVRDYEARPGKMKPHDVAHPKMNQKLIGLNYEDVVELRDLAARLTDILVPAAS